MANVAGLIMRFADLSAGANRSSEEYGVGDDLTDDLDDACDAARFNGLRDAYAEVVEKLKEQL